MWRAKICPPDRNRVNGGGIVIFNDANVMTTDDIVTTCQRERAQPAPWLKEGLKIRGGDQTGIEGEGLYLCQNWGELPP